MKKPLVVILVLVFAAAGVYFFSQSKQGSGLLKLPVISLGLKSEESAESQGLLAQDSLVRSLKSEMMFVVQFSPRRTDLFFSSLKNFSDSITEKPFWKKLKLAEKLEDELTSAKRQELQESAKELWETLGNYWSRLDEVVFAFPNSFVELGGVEIPKTLIALTFVDENLPNEFQKTLTEAITKAQKGTTSALSLKKRPGNNNILDFTVALKNGSELSGATEADARQLYITLGVSDKDEFFASGGDKLVDSPQWKGLASTLSDKAPGSLMFALPKQFGKYYAKLLGNVLALNANIGEQQADEQQKMFQMIESSWGSFGAWLAAARFEKDVVFEQCIELTPNSPMEKVYQTFFEKRGSLATLSDSYLSRMVTANTFLGFMYSGDALGLMLESVASQYSADLPAASGMDPTQLKQLTSKLNEIRKTLSSYSIQEVALVMSRQLGPVPEVHLALHGNGLGDSSFLEDVALLINNVLGKPGGLPLIALTKNADNRTLIKLTDAQQFPVVGTALSSDLVMFGMNEFSLKKAFTAINAKGPRYLLKVFSEYASLKTESATYLNIKPLSEMLKPLLGFFAAGLQEKGISPAELNEMIDMFNQSILIAGYSYRGRPSDICSQMTTALGSYAQ